MFKVANKPCKNCLFSTDRIVSPERAASILQGCRENDNHFICHKASAASEDICCRTFYDRLSTNMIRTMGRLGAIEFVDLPDNEPLIPYAKRRVRQIEGDRE